MSTPNGVSAEKEIDGKRFRVCDRYALLLTQMVEGAPPFQIYWPETQRDDAIPAFEKLLEPNSRPLKTHPFR
jgi:hypothetical protein